MAGIDGNFATGFGSGLNRAIQALGLGGNVRQQAQMQGGLMGAQTAAAGTRAQLDQQKLDLVDRAVKALNLPGLDQREQYNYLIGAANGQQVNPFDFDYKTGTAGNKATGQMGIAAPALRAIYGDQAAAEVAASRARAASSYASAAASRAGASSTRAYSPLPSADGYLIPRADGSLTWLKDEQGNRIIPPNMNATVQADVAGAKAGAQVKGKAQAENAIALPGALANIDQTLDVIQGLKDSRGKVWSTGAFSMLPVAPGTPQADFRARLEQARGQAFLRAFKSLKGGGQITEVEGKKATDAIARLDTAQSPEAFDQALDDFAAVLKAGRLRLQQGAGMAPAAPAASSSGYSNLWGE